jgi:hypothetical protein
MHRYTSPFPHHRYVSGDAAKGKCLIDAWIESLVAVRVQDPEKSHTKHTNFGSAVAVPVTDDRHVAGNAAEREDLIAGIDCVVSVGI